jgi:N-sulfoglucosamine sulfohydrolase
MNRKLFLLANSRTAAFIILLSLNAFSIAEQDRPNILLLMAEDLSPRIGAFGDPVAVTPNLDKLAAEGVRYTNVFAASGVCATNRAALITGMAQESMGGQHMRAYSGSFNYQASPPPEVKAFPELLRAADYYTFATSKLDYQFSKIAPGTGPFTIWDWESKSGDWATPEAKPFFGYMTFLSTHESGVFPRWTWPRNFPHMTMQTVHIYLHWNTEDKVAAKDVEVPPYYPDTPPIRQDIARHYNNIITMDRNVGEVLRRLEEEGLADDTIVIWTTDHGDGLPRAKRELYDSGLHTPMIIRWPERWRPKGVIPGSVNNRLVSVVDIAPTILSLAGAPIPTFIQGKVFAGPKEDEPRQYIFAARDRIDAIPDRQRAARDERHKYIKNYNRQAGAFHLRFRDTTDGMRDLWRAFEANEMNDIQRQWFESRPEEYLFDTQLDPFEINNLAADPKNVETLQRMRGALETHKASIKDYSDMNETVMAELFWPGGQQPLTLPVMFSEQEGKIEMSSATEGASVGYRIEDQPWQLYTKPLNLPPNKKLEAKAIRYGWQESLTSEHKRLR